MTSLFREALGLVSALQRSAPCTYHQECEQDRRNSVEKDQDRLISFCICIDLSRLIPYFLLLHRTERRKHADAVRSCHDHKYYISSFQCKIDKSFYHLAMDNISKAHEHHGKLCLDPAFFDCIHAGIRRRKFIYSLFKNTHPHLPPYDNPSLFIASFIASVCSSALSWVTLPFRIPFPRFSTGVQQLFICDTNGCMIDV